MPTADTVAELTAFADRGGGTDAERRAARRLAAQLTGTGRRVRLETFWCRANWALAHAWHVALAIAGSLLSVSSAPAGGALLLVALLSVIADATVGLSPGRRLTPERASQNVAAGPLGPRTPVAPPPAGDDRNRVRLVITANYDAARQGLIYRDLPRSLAAKVRTKLKAPGWLGWVAIAIVWLLVIAIVRAEGHRSTAVGVAQLIPTVGLVLTFAALIDVATAGYGKGANDNASGVAVALAIVRALDAAPPANLAVELLLHGAGRHGLDAYLKAREPKPNDTVVLAIAPCGSGDPRWWQSDGPLVPLRYAPRLREVAASAGTGTKPVHGRGESRAWAARRRGIPALAIGCLDERGIAPDGVDAAVLDRAVQFGLILVDAIDAAVAEIRERPRTLPTPA